MLNKIEPTNVFEDAAKQLLAEFENRTQIAEIILGKMSTFYFTMQEIYNISTMPMESLDEAVNDRILATLTYFSELAPWFVLSYSELPWTQFFNNYMMVITTYQTMLEKEYNYEKASMLFEQLRPIMLLSEIGAGYEALISAGNMIVAELKLWKNVSSPSLTLSHQYLRSLGYYDSQDQDQSAGEC